MARFSGTPIEQPTAGPRFGGTPVSLDNLLEPQQKIQAPSFDDPYLQDLMRLENAPLMGMQDTDLLKPNLAPELGGGQDFGFGHKIQQTELDEGNIYGIPIGPQMTVGDAKTILQKDLEKHRRLARESVGGDVFDKLNPTVQNLLTDYSFTGVLDQFPKFRDALVSGDLDTAEKEYVRYMTDPSGQKVPLGARNTYTLAQLHKLHTDGQKQVPSLLEPQEAIAQTQMGTEVPQQGGFDIKKFLTEANPLGSIEGLASATTGMASSLPALVVGLGEVLQGTMAGDPVGGFASAQKEFEKVMEAGTYQSKTPGGQKIAEYVAMPFVEAEKGVEGLVRRAGGGDKEAEAAKFAFNAFLFAAPALSGKVKSGKKLTPAEAEEVKTKVQEAAPDVPVSAIDEVLAKVKQEPDAKLETPSATVPTNQHIVDALMEEANKRTGPKRLAYKSAAEKVAKWEQDAADADLGTISKTEGKLRKRIKELVEQRGKEEVVPTTDLKNIENKLVEERESLSDGTVPVAGTLHELLHDATVATAHTANNPRTYELLDMAYKMNRPDIADYIIRRMEHNAENMSTVPGVSKNSPKYAEIEKTLINNKTSEITTAKNLRRKHEEITSNESSAPEGVTPPVEEAKPRFQGTPVDRTAAVGSRMEAGMVEPPPLDLTRAVEPAKALDLNEKLKGAKTTKEALEIVKGETNPEFVPIIDRIVGVLEDSPFKLVENLEGLHPKVQEVLGKAYGAQALGLTTQKPHVWVAGRGLRENPNLHRTVVHEGLHAATTTKLTEGLKDLEGKTIEGRAAKELDILREQVAAEFEARRKINSKLKMTKAQREAFRSPAELVTYGLLDGEFREFLKTVKIEGESAFNKFVEKVRELLGLDPKETNALTRLIELTDDLIEGAEPKKAREPEVARGDVVGSRLEAGMVEPPLPLEEVLARVKREKEIREQVKKELETPPEKVVGRPEELGKREPTPEELAAEERMLEEDLAALEDSLAQEQRTQDSTPVEGKAARKELLQQAYKQWRDSYVEKINTGKKAKGTAPIENPADLGVVKGGFRVFKRREDAEAYREAHGLEQEIITDPLTGESYLEPDMREIDGPDWRAVDQYEDPTVVEDGYDGGTGFDLSDTGTRDLYDIFNREIIDLDANFNLAQQLIDEARKTNQDIDTLLKSRSDISDKQLNSIRKLTIEFPDDIGKPKSNIINLGKDPIKVQELRRELTKDHPELLTNDRSIDPTNPSWIEKANKINYSPLEIAEVHAYPEGWTRTDKGREIILGVSKGYIDKARKFVDRVGVNNAIRQSARPYNQSKWDIINEVARLFQMEKEGHKWATERLDQARKAGGIPKLTIKKNDFSNFNLEQIDIAELKIATDKLRELKAEAQRVGKPVGELLDSMGVSPELREKIVAQVDKIDENARKLREADPIVEGILNPEGDIAYQRTKKNKKTGQVRTKVPMTVKLKTALMQAKKIPESGKLGSMLDAVEIRINRFERFSKELKTTFYDAWIKKLADSKREFRGVRRELKADLKGVSKEDRLKMSIVAHSRQKNGPELLARMGINEIPTLTPAQEALVQKYGDKLAKLRDRINYVRVKTGLRPLGKVDNYFTWAHKVNHMKDARILANEAAEFGPSFKGHSKEFKGSFFPYAERRGKKPTAIELDIFDGYEKYVAGALKEIHINPIAALAKEASNLVLVDKPRIRLGSTNPQLVKLLREWSDEILGIDPAYAGAATKMGKIAAWGEQRIHNLTLATLFGNASTALKQPLALIGVMSETRLRDVMWGLGRTLVDVGKGSESTARQKSSVLEVRVMDLMFDEMAQNISKEGMAGVKRTAAELASWPMTFLDSMTAQAGWNAAYRYGKRKLKLNEAEAIQHADDVVTRTQGVGVRGAVSPIQASRITKWATLFQTFAINDFNYIARDLVGIRHPDIKRPEQVKKVLKYVAASMLANSLFEMAGLDAPKPAPIQEYRKAKDEGESKGAATGQALLELLEVVPLIGGAIKYESSALGAAGEFAKDIPEALRSTLGLIDWGSMTPGEKRKSVETIAETLGKYYGVPMTAQIKKSMRTAQRSDDPWEILLGVYIEEGRKSKSGLPSLPELPELPSLPAL